MTYEDEFIRVINKPDQFYPEVWTRQIEMVQIGARFFGLFPVYKTVYSEWKKDSNETR
jgi:hypothetical protein